MQADNTPVRRNLSIPPDANADLNFCADANRRTVSRRGGGHGRVARTVDSVLRPALPQGPPGRAPAGREGRVMSATNRIFQNGTLYVRDDIFVRSELESRNAFNSAAGEVNKLEGQRDALIEAVKALIDAPEGMLNEHELKRKQAAEDMGRIAIAACEGPRPIQPATGYQRNVTPAPGQPARPEDAFPESCCEGVAAPMPPKGEQS